MNYPSLAAELRARDSLMEVKEVAKLLGKHKDTIYDWAKAGKIPTELIGSHTMFDPRKVATWLDARSTCG